MIKQQDVEQAVKRMQSVWPRVQTTPGLKAEMVASVMRHAGKLEPADLAAGVDSLIESRPAAQDTGWAAAPPGPHEVVGCLLTARATRMQNAPAVRTSLAQGTRDKMRQGLPITAQEGNAREVWVPGITFAAWWASLTVSEQHDHATLRAYMTKDADLIPIHG